MAIYMQTFSSVLNGGLNKKSLNLKRVLYPILDDDMPILFLDPFLEPYELFNYLFIYIRLP